MSPWQILDKRLIRFALNRLLNKLHLWSNIAQRNPFS